MDKPDFEMLEQACKLITKYALKELTINPDGSITIVKDLHVQPQVKKPRGKSVKKIVPPGLPNVDLSMVAVNLNNKADRIGQLNNYNRYQTNTILPNQGKDS